MEIETRNIDQQKQRHIETMQDFNRTLLERDREAAAYRKISEAPAALRYDLLLEKMSFATFDFCECTDN